MSKMRFSKRKLRFLCWRSRNRKNNKKHNGKGKTNPIKIVFFKVVIQTVKNKKK